MKFYLSILILCALIVACGKSDSPKTEVKKETEGTNKVANKTLDSEREKGSAGSLESNSGKLPAYEIISSNANNNSFVVCVPAASESEIIALNDYLYSEKKINGKPLLINYFDNKKIADSYFSNQMSTKLSSAEKEKEFLHYIYNFKYIPSGYKALFKNVSGNWKEIKSY